MGTHYETLSVSPSATEAEIKRAWKKAAVDSHPDTHPDDPAAAERFQAAAAAYEVLSDKLRRAAYDYALDEPARKEEEAIRNAEASSHGYASAADLRGWEDLDWLNLARGQRDRFTAQRQSHRTEPVGVSLKYVVSYRDPWGNVYEYGTFEHGDEADEVATMLVTRRGMRDAWVHWKRHRMGSGT